MVVEGAFACERDWFKRCLVPQLRALSRDVWPEEDEDLRISVLAEEMLRVLSQEHMITEIEL